MLTLTKNVLNCDLGINNDEKSLSFFQVIVINVINTMNDDS